MLTSSYIFFFTFSNKFCRLISNSFFQLFFILHFWYLWSFLTSLSCFLAFFWSTLRWSFMFLVKNTIWFGMFQENSYHPVKEQNKYNSVLPIIILQLSKKLLIRLLLCYSVFTPSGVNTGSWCSPSKYSTPKYTKEIPEILTPITEFLKKYFTDN